MTEPRGVLVVDDEAPARTNLRLALSRHPQWRVVAEAADAAEARAALGRGAVDLVFLDVQMPGEDGISLARWLAARPEPPIVVFATAYDRFAVDAFEAHALDYLLKPFDDARLAQALERAAQLIELQQRASYAAALAGLADQQRAAAEGRPAPWPTHVSVKSVRRIERIALDEVLWIASAGNYVELHLAQRVVLHRAPLAWMEARLDPAAFVRVHRRALVRRQALREFRSSAGEGPVAVLSNGERVPVSAPYVAAVRALLG